MFQTLSRWIAGRNASGPRHAARRRKRAIPSLDGLEGRQLLSSIVPPRGNMPLNLGRVPAHVGSLGGVFYTPRSSGNVNDSGTSPAPQSPASTLPPPVIITPPPGGTIPLPPAPVPIPAPPGGTIPLPPAPVPIPAPPSVPIPLPPTIASVVYQSGTMPSNIAHEAVYVGSVQGVSYALLGDGEVDVYGNDTGVDPSTNLSTVFTDGKPVSTVEIGGQTWKYTDGAGWQFEGPGSAPGDARYQTPPPGSSPQPVPRTGHPSSHRSGSQRRKDVASHHQAVHHQPAAIHEPTGPAGKE